MESRFDMTNFEQSLKEHADQFTMQPSKKVWNGIYNSLHPGSIWPSISMILLFLLALVGIGPLNNSSNNFRTNSPAKFNTDLKSNSEITIEEGRKSEEITNIKNYLFAKRSPLNALTEPGKVVTLQSYFQKNAQNIQELKNSSVEKLIENSGPGENGHFLNTPAKVIETLPSQAGVSLKEVTGKNIKKAEMASLSLPGLTDQISGNFENVTLRPDFLNPSFINTESKLFIVTSPEFNEVNSVQIPSAGEPIKAGFLSKKKNTKVAWIFYFTPSVSSVYFKGKALNEITPQNSNLSPIIINPSAVGNQMRYNARAGLNIGTEMNYSIAEGWQMIGGVQISYAGYNILSHKVHPSFAELVLKDRDHGTLTKRYITYYGSGEGQDEITLHNNSFQLSMPMGIKHSVWKNNNVEISISATVEPLLVVHSKAYMLSADGRNYVNDPELMRESNVSGQLGSTISFSGEKVKWHIGPVVRYQALSSFKNIYPINEHLIDYGIRIGISK